MRISADRALLSAGRKLHAEQSAKIAKVGGDAGPMLFVSPRFEDERKNDFGGTFPGGTIVRASLLARPDFLISWQSFSASNRKRRAGVNAVKRLAECLTPCGDCHHTRCKERPPWRSSFASARSGAEDVMVQDCCLVDSDS